MKNKKLLGRNVSFLIVGVLTVLAFIRGDAQFWCLAGVFAIFTVWTLISANIKYGKKIIGRKTKRDKNNSSAEKNGNDAALLHLNCRVSEYLKSAYPDIKWEWVTENPGKLAAEGGAGQIKLFDTADFNYADISFDQFARIECKMIKTVPFNDLKTNGSVIPESAPAPVQQANQQTVEVDPATWYSIQGKSVLEACVAHLNAHGHSGLTIKENGDICVQEDSEEKVSDTLKNFPGKTAWQQLVKVFETRGLAASVMNDCINVSW